MLKFPRYPQFPPQQSPLRRAPPIVTLVSDFGIDDPYVAQMKAAILARCRAAVLVDVTHSVRPQDVAGGSIALERAVAGFPAGTVHLAVVDPGVGTDRRLLAARICRSVIVCPDNGLVTWAFRRHAPASFFQLHWRPAQSSHTFHGRDVMAPIAAMLAAGVPLMQLVRPMNDPVLLDLDLAPPGAAAGQIIHIDRYGNATTNLGRSHIPSPAASVHIANLDIGPLRRTYADVPPGQPLALFGSSDLLEIAVRNGSARDQLDLHIGDAVELR